MRVAIYVRVSTEDQAREGYSLDAQEKRLKAYCSLRDNWVIVDTYRDEGYSGRDIKRPEYRRMMADMDKWDIILVLKMDRIHRNSVRFTEMMNILGKNGKAFTSLMEKLDTTTAMGRFVMDIMQRMAQLESERTGERVKFAMTEKARKGDGPMGSGHPYGYRYSNGNLIIIEYEAENVRRIFDLYSQGCTLDHIVTVLTNSNVPSKTGGRWSRQSVYRILHNPLYAGFLRWDGNIYMGRTPAIVDKEKFEGINGAVELTDLTKKV